MPYLIALPLSIYAAMLGSRALRTAATDDARALGNAGLVGGVLSACVNGMFALFFLFYLILFVLYFVLIFMAIGVSGLEQ